jgi:hypothetical protein
MITKTKTASAKRRASKKPKIVPKTETGRILEQFADDHVWIARNREKLLAQYGEQWIAVENGKVIANDQDVHGLRKKLARPAFTCVEFLAREPLLIWPSVFTSDELMKRAEFFGYKDHPISQKQRG